MGLYIGYDNKDGTFAKAELNGQVSGQLWTTMGDDAQRRYDYTYDNAGRLLSANFTEREKPGDTWNTEKMNLGVSGQNGRIGYDLNGNILSMVHKGVTAGQQRNGNGRRLKLYLCGIQQQAAEGNRCQPPGQPEWQPGRF